MKKLFIVCGLIFVMNPVAHAMARNNLATSRNNDAFEQRGEQHADRMYAESNAYIHNRLARSVHKISPKGYRTLDCDILSMGEWQCDFSLPNKDICRGNSVYLLKRAPPYEINGVPVLASTYSGYLGVYFTCRSPSGKDRKFEFTYKIPAKIFSYIK